MAKRKTWSPPKSTKPKTTFKPVKRTTVPAFPADPIRPPSQPKLDGFTTVEFEEIEAAAERFATVQDRVKTQKKKLQEELDREETKLKIVMKRYGRQSIVIGGYNVQIVETSKAKVKGVPPPKEEKEDDTQIEISSGGRSVTLTPQQMAQAAENLS